MKSFHMGRCVKILEDTLLYTSAAVKCCSYKYQKIREERSMRNRSRPGKKSQPNSLSFTFLKQGQIKPTKSRTLWNNVQQEHLMACHVEVVAEPVLGQSWVHVVSRVGHHYTGDTRAQQGRLWVVFRYIPREIHLALMEGPNSKPGIWLICRTNVGLAWETDAVLNIQETQCSVFKINLDMVVTFLR